MNRDELLELLDTLIECWENEVVEFKRGKKSFRYPILENISQQ